MSYKIKNEFFKNKYILVGLVVAFAPLGQGLDIFLKAWLNVNLNEARVV